MNRKQKLLLGVAAFGPGLGLVHAIVAFLIFNGLYAVWPGRIVRVLYPLIIYPAFITWTLGCVSCVVALFLCIRHLDEKKWTLKQRLPWMFWMGLWLIGVPVYWYRHIWHDDEG